MFRTVTLFVLTAALVGASARAQETGFGLGIIVGEPTGLSVKGWIGQNRAIDGAIAWSFGKKDALHLHADFLFHDFDLLRVEKGLLPLYYGVGGRIELEEEDRLGLRLPVGLEYLFPEAPVGIFFEIVPVLDVAPRTEFDVNAGVGVRYFFR